MDSYRIGEMARLAGVSTETIRFYERRGLIESPPRTPAGYRHYSRAALERLMMVRRVKDLGFSLGEISELLQTLDKGCSDCTLCRKNHCRATAKLREIEGRIDELQRIRDNLKALLNGCESRQRKCTLLSLLGIENGLDAALSIKGGGFP